MLKNLYWISAACRVIYIAISWFWGQSDYFQLPEIIKKTVRRDLQLQFYVVLQSLRCVRLLATPRTAARQASLSLTVSWSLHKLMPLSWWCHPTISSSVDVIYSLRMNSLKWNCQIRRYTHCQRHLMPVIKLLSRNVILKLYSPEVCTTTY